MKTKKAVMTKTMWSQKEARFNASWKYIRDKN